MAENESEGVGGARSLGDQGADATAHRRTKTPALGWAGWMEVLKVWRARSQYLRK